MVFGVTRVCPVDYMYFGENMFAVNFCYAFLEIGLM